MMTYEELQAQNTALRGRLNVLDEQVLARDAEIVKLNSSIEDLSRQLVFLKKYQFGRSSEKLNSDQQLGFFNEAEAELERAKDKPTGKDPAKKPRRGSPKRRPIPENLPRREVVIELSEEERRCEKDGSLLEVIGQDVSEKINVIPARVEVVRTIRNKYGCKACHEGVKIAPMPLHILPKALADAGLLALIVVSKFVDALPLYRQERILERINAYIPRSTMASWVIELGQKLMVLRNLMRDHLIASPYLHVDETRVQVLDKLCKTGKPSKDKRGFMWVFARAGPKPIIVFDYAPTRSGEHASAFLDDFSGALHADGFDGCNATGATLRLGCMAHLRRKFFDAWKALGEPSKGIAFDVLGIIRDIYEQEKIVRGKAPELRQKHRQEFTRPLYEKLFEELSTGKVECLPQSATGKAITYALNEWSYMENYLENGLYEIDNNFVENKIRPFAVGRKNWLFSATTKGAEASAVLYSLAQTAIANDIDVYQYFHWLFTEFPKAQSADDFEKLLPHNAKSLITMPQETQHVLP